MKYLLRVFYSIAAFLVGWLFNFVLDIQFTFGVIAGWLMKEGYDNIADLLTKLVQGFENIIAIMISVF